MLRRGPARSVHTGVEIYIKVPFNALRACPEVVYFKDLSIVSISTPLFHSYETGGQLFVELIMKLRNIMRILIQFMLMEIVFCSLIVLFGFCLKLLVELISSFN